MKLSIKIILIIGEMRTHLLPMGVENGLLLESIMNQLQSGYVRRGGSALPRQGSSAPWEVTHDYFSDRKLLLDAPIDDGVLEIGT